MSLPRYATVIVAKGSKAGAIRAWNEALGSGPTTREGFKAEPIFMAMKKTLFMVILMVFSCSQIVSAEDVVITIRLINGKNGKPIKDEALNVFPNRTRFAESYRADRDGIIRLIIDRNATVSFMSNIQITCHKLTEAEITSHELEKYSVEAIMSQGIVDTNTCSKKVRMEAKRGEFIYYERPRTLREWMAL